MCPGPWLQHHDSRSNNMIDTKRSQAVAHIRVSERALTDRGAADEPASLRAARAVWWRERVCFKRRRNADTFAPQLYKRREAAGAAQTGRSAESDSRPPTMGETSHKVALTPRRWRRLLCRSPSTVVGPAAAPPRARRHRRRLGRTISWQTLMQHRVRAQGETGESCRLPPPLQLLSAAARPRRCPPKSTKVGKLRNPRRSQLLCSVSAW